MVLDDHDAIGGKAEAQGKRAAEMIKAMPETPVKVARIKGNQGEYGTGQYEKGQNEFLQPLIDSGKVKVVCEQYTQNWDRAFAQSFAEDCLTRNGGDVDVFIGMNDGTTGGAVAALINQGFKPGRARHRRSGRDGRGPPLHRAGLAGQLYPEGVDAIEVRNDISGRESSDGTKAEDLRAILDDAGLRLASINALQRLNDWDRDGEDEAVSRPLRSSVRRARHCSVPGRRPRHDGRSAARRNAPAFAAQVTADPA